VFKTSVENAVKGLNILALFPWLDTQILSSIFFPGTSSYNSAGLTSGKGQGSPATRARLLSKLNLALDFT
jgi:hypothetical protein